jgi:hypothetical protein
MKVPEHPEFLQNGTVLIDKLRPMLDFYIIKEEGRVNLEFNFTYLNFTANYLIVSIEFTNPAYNSAWTSKDKLGLTVNGN